METISKGGRELSDEEIKKIVVRVRKSSVPIGGLIDYVEAEVIKENGE